MQKAHKTCYVYYTWKSGQLGQCNFVSNANNKVFVPEAVSVGSLAVRFFQSTVPSPSSGGHFHVVWLLMLSHSQHMISADTEK